MNKKILNYLLGISSLTLLFFGEILIHFTKIIDIDRVPFETIYMPVMALSKISLPFLLIGLFITNLRKGSVIVGIVFLVIGSFIMISGIDNYETWNALLKENSEDPRFQNNFSGQLYYHIFEIIEGILLLSGVPSFLSMSSPRIGKSVRYAMLSSSPG